MRSKTKRQCAVALPLIVFAAITAIYFFESCGDASQFAGANDDLVVRESLADRAPGSIQDPEEKELLPEAVAQVAEVENTEDGVAFLSNLQPDVRRGKDNLMLYPNLTRIARVPVAGSVFERKVFEVLSHQPTGDLTYTDVTKSAAEAQMDLSVIRAFLQSDAQYLSVPVSVSESLLLDIQSIEAQGLHTVALVGKVKDRPVTQVRIVFHDGAVAGSVELLDESTYYQFGMAGNGAVAIRLMDMEKNIYGGCANCDCSHQHEMLFDEENASEEAVPSELLFDEMSTSADYTHVIDGVVSYTTAVKNAAGGTAAMEAKVLLSTGFINDALMNSQISNTVVTLLGTVEEVDHSKGLVATFSDIQAGNLAVNNLWVTLGADYAATVYNGGSGVADLGGIYYVSGDGGLNSSAGTMVHEFGHLLNCQHAWGDNAGGGGTLNNKSNFGWRFKDSSGTKNRTVMSYSGGWATLRIGYFSSPLVTFNGALTGAVEGFNASGNTDIDPQLVSGGAIGTAGAGYDGSNAELGADNRAEVLSEIPSYTNKNIREENAVVQPAAGSVYYIGREELIYWLGGDHTQSVEIELYKSGVFHSAIATVTHAHMRWENWTVPNLPEDDDYSIRVTLEGETPFTSGQFSIRQSRAYAEDISLTAISELPRETALPTVPDITLGYSYTQPANGTLTGVAPDLIYTSNAGSTTDSFTYYTTYNGETSETATVSLSITKEVAHWPLDDGNGTLVADVSGNNYHGTLTTGTWVAAGKLDGALEFNGGTDSVSLPASAFAGMTHQMTLSMWVYGDASQPVQDAVFSMIDENSAPIMIMRIGTPIASLDGTIPRNYWYAAENGSGTNLFKDTTDSEIKGGWNHYVFVKNASSAQMKIYLNGALWAEKMNSSSVSGTASAYLGSWQGAQNYNGMIDNVRLYDVEMTAAAVAGLYRLEAYTAPVAYAQSVVAPKNDLQVISLSSSSSSASYTVVDYPTHGALSGVAPDLTYTPTVDYEGADSFTFYASDSGLDSSTVTVTIDVVDFADFVTIKRVTTGTGYDIAQAEAVWFRSTGTAKTYDADGDDAYGTVGYYFYGNGSNKNSDSDGSPSWVTEVDSTGVSLVALSGYVDFDNPTQPISNAVSDWTTTTIGLVNTAGTTGGLWAELMTFTVDASAPRNFRLGVMAGNEVTPDGRWDPEALRLSFSGGSPVEISGLATSLGMLFFDVVIQDNVSGTFTIEGQTRSGLGSNTRGPSIAGITFDVIPPGFQSWLINYPTLTDTSVDGDPDTDGIENLLEYVLNGDPTQNGDVILPELDAAGENFVFSFTRLASSATDTMQVFQYSSTLESNDWTNLSITDPKAAEVTISAEVDGLQTVTVTISKSVATDKKLFGRLKIKHPQVE